MTSPAAVATHRPAHSQAHENAAISGIGSAIAGIVRRIATAYARARTMQALNGLDDNALKDIGLTRSQIGSFEHDPRYRPHYTRF